MEKIKQVVWADGDTQNAIEIEVVESAGLDYEEAAAQLGCEVSQVNHCGWGQVDAYGVSLKT